LVRVDVAVVADLREQAVVALQIREDHGVAIRDHSQAARCLLPVLPGEDHLLWPDQRLLGCVHRVRDHPAARQESSGDNDADAESDRAHRAEQFAAIIAGIRALIRPNPLASDAIRSHMTTDVNGGWVLLTSSPPQHAASVGWEMIE
jgi:hypothetical protein